MANRGNILVLSAQVPFTRGGAELLCEGLCDELRKRDFGVELVALPFSAQPIESLLKQVSLWRALDLSKFAGRTVDLVIGTKFPTYAARHPKKSLWLIHQHRQLYDLWGTRFGDFSTSDQHEALRRLLMRADQRALQECSAVYTISPNVSARLKRYSDCDSGVLTPPLPCGNRSYRGEKQDYILSVGRLCSIKRTDLILKALAQVDSRLRLKIVGVSDEPGYDSYLESEVRLHNLSSRVDFLGRVGEAELTKLYAEAFAVYYAPFDEDYGFVTLEAIASGAPVITATDSGGVLAFVEHERNGLVVEPTGVAIAEAINRLVAQPALHVKLSNYLLENPHSATAKALSVTWDEIVAELTSPLFEAQAHVTSTQRVAN